MLADGEAEQDGLKIEIDWPSFMARQDMIWDRMPDDYFEGPFVGNGLMGTILYRDDKVANSLRFEIGRTDVYDNRAEAGSVMHYGARLPIGNLLLTPAGEITSSSFRVNLWDAEITGTISTKLGAIKLRCLAPCDTEVLIIQTVLTGGEREARLRFRPEQGNSPRHSVEPERDKNFVYVPNPPFQIANVDGMDVCVQPLPAGSDYATAWKETGIEYGEEAARTFILSVANRRNRSGSAEDAVENIEHAITCGVPALVQRHREWWHAFYPMSFVTVPEPRLESFHWIQLYKMASATREDRPVVDLMGPWFKPSVWAAYWQNLNTQLAYYSVLPSNHPELGESLCRLLHERRQDLIDNVPPEYRADSAALGNPTGFGNLIAPAPGPVKEKLGGGAYHFIALPWLMHQFYLQYRFTMDEERLCDEIYPLLKRTVKTYLHVIDLGADGRYHIPMAFSDEYGAAEDTNLNLALLRWGLQTLLACDRRHQFHDPDTAQWREVLGKLADYPSGESGLLLGKDAPFEKPHRHYSHLLAIFPLHVLNIDDHPEMRPLMEKSIAHFIGLDGDNCIFKFTGASSLYAALGEADCSLHWLRRALEPQAEGPTIGLNTLYSENGWPTFESPISAQRSILDMLLQSWGGVIRIFPACPGEWPEAAFHDLRAEGAFLVSARREAGRTLFVRVKSLAGEPCLIKTDLADPVIVDGALHSPTRRSDGLLELDLKKGEEALLHTMGARGPFVIEPLPACPSQVNAWGAKK
jgi:hypothetical protein